MPTNSLPSEPSRPDLACLFDDPSNPSKLTLYPAGTDSPATEWLTVDWGTVRSLDRHR